MASGDTDRIEVMDISVAKKAENANAATGTEDDGSTFLNLIIKKRIELFIIAFITKFPVNLISFCNSRKFSLCRSR